MRGRKLLGGADGGEAIAIDEHRAAVQHAVFVVHRDDGGIRDQRGHTHS